MYLFKDMISSKMTSQKWHVNPVTEHSGVLRRCFVTRNKHLVLHKTRAQWKKLHPSDSMKRLNVSFSTFIQIHTTSCFNEA